MRSVLLIVLLFVLASCGNNHDYTPKPRGYFRIVFPKKEYQEYAGGCPFTFTYPKYAKLEADPFAPSKPCWINMQFPEFKGTLHLTYEPVTSRRILDTLMEHAWFYVSKQTVKATGIDDTIIRNPVYKIFGLYYTIQGNVASSAQFYLTDSTHHYLRGALYFNTEPRLDSIQPVLDFVKKDVNVMIRSFRWKTKG